MRIHLVPLLPRICVVVVSSVFFYFLPIFLVQVSDK